MLTCGPVGRNGIWRAGYSWCNMTSAHIHYSLVIDESISVALPLMIPIWKKKIYMLNYRSWTFVTRSVDWNMCSLSLTVVSVHLKLELEGLFTTKCIVCYWRCICYCCANLLLLVVGCEFFFQKRFTGCERSMSRTWWALFRVDRTEFEFTMNFFFDFRR